MMFQFREGEEDRKRRSRNPRCVVGVGQHSLAHIYPESGVVHLLHTVLMCVRVSEIMLAITSRILSKKLPCSPQSLKNPPKWQRRRHFRGGTVGPVGVPEAGARLQL